MDKLEHHSLSDWDWSPVNTPVLDDAQKVSSPTALCGRYKSGVWRAGWCFLKNPSNLPYGRLVTYERRKIAVGLTLYWYFKAQDYPPTYDGYPPNCYYLCYTGSYWYLRRRVNNGQTQLASGTLANPFGADTWVWLRLTWYPYIEDPLTPKLGILFERYVNNVWTQQFLFIDEANMWKDSPVNKVGFYLRPYSSTEGYNQWMDDTEIWKPKVV